MIFSFFYPCYLPTLQELANLVNDDYIFFTDHFQFVKRSRLTRARFNPSRPYLSIPVEHSGKPVAISQKKIRRDENWTENHLKSLYHLYHNLPFFEYYYPRLKVIYRVPNIYLVDVLYSLLDFYKSAFQFRGDIIKLSGYFKEQISTGQLLQHIKDNFPVSGYGAIADTNTLFPLLDNMDLKYSKEWPLPNKFPFELNPLEFLFTFGAEAAYLLRTH